MLKLYTLGFYYLDDYDERCHYYNICAYSEKQARFFLGQNLGITFANTLKQAYVLRYKTKNKIVILIHNSFAAINGNSSELLGKIIDY